MKRKVYLVTIVCAFDDVVVGCYLTLKQARKRAKEARQDSSIRFDYEDFVSVDTDPKFVRISCFLGKKQISADDTDFSYNSETA